jgi:hypothetical protein
MSDVLVGALVYPAGTLPRPTLESSLTALTESLVDSVMAAIRSASLEELLGERRERPTRARRRVREDRITALAPTAPAPDDTPTEAHEEITDPQMLLALGTAPPLVDEAPQPFPEFEEPSSGPQLRLRDNETVARVSNAGVVIRRARQA